MSELDRPRLRPVEINPVEENGERFFVVHDQQQLSDQSLVVSPTGAWLLQHFTGENSREEIREKFREETGESLPSDMLRELIDALDENYLLQNERAQQRIQSVVDDFKQRDVRRATLPGQSIPGDPGDLSQFFAETLEAQDGSEPETDFDGLVLPHIDYFRGQKTYTKTLPHLEAMPDFERVVILGISHYSCPVPFSITDKAYETPHGTVPVDEDALNRLQSALPYEPSEGEIAHRLEHSVEIPLLLLQHVYPDREFSIVPIICSYRDESSVDGILDDVIDEIDHLLEDPETQLLAGVDFAHMGTQFGDREPLSEDDYESIEEHDRAMLDTITGADETEFEEHIQSDNNRRRVCGYPAIRTLLPLFETGDLIDYDQAQDPHETVTYGALRMCR